MVTDPVSHSANDISLPLLALRIGVAGITVDSKAVLSAVNLDQSMLGRHLLSCPPGGLHRNERILGTMHNERRSVNVTEHGMRLKIEYFI